MEDFASYGKLNAFLYLSILETSRIIKDFGLNQAKRQSLNESAFVKCGDLTLFLLFCEAIEVIQETPRPGAG